MGKILGKGVFLGSPSIHDGALLNPLPDLADGNTLAYFDRTEAEGVLKDATNQDKIYWDLFAGSAGRGAEQATGNIVLYGVYEITATQADFFYTGCAVGDIFPCAVVKTCDANNKVKRVLGNHLVSLGATTRPLNGILDGVNDYMKTAPFTANQPICIYFLFRQIRLNYGLQFFDGNAKYYGHIEQDQATNGIKAYAGAFSPVDNTLQMNKFGIIRVLFNGASSSLQVDDTLYSGINLGTRAPGGFTLGAAGDLSTAFSNIEFIAAIIRKGVDSDDFKTDLLNWFKYKRNAINRQHLLTNLPVVNYKYHILCQKGNKIFATNLSNKLLYSTDNGVNYTEIAFANANKTQMGYIFENGNLLVTTSTEVYKSTDNLASLVAVTPLDLDGNPYTPNGTDEFLPLHTIDAQIVDDGELIMFGTYGGKARVWTSLNGENMKMVYRFTERSGTPVYDYAALHIHTCVFEPVAKKWYVNTGDLDNECHWIAGAYNESTAEWTWEYVVAGATTNQLKSTSIKVFENKFFWGSDQTSGHDTQGVWSSAINTVDDINTHVREFEWDQELISILVETDRILFTDIHWNTVNKEWKLHVFNRATGTITSKKFELLYNPPTSEATKYNSWLCHIKKVRDGEYMLEVFSQLLFRTIRFYI